MQDGKFFEGAVLGECTASWDGYMSYKEAMCAVRQAQPGGDPTDPVKDTASDLHVFVCEELGCDDYSFVKFFTAIGSPLDFFHGVDAWFEFNGRVVTIDVTLNPNKEKPKADLVILGQDDGISRETLRLSAKQIAKKFQKREIFC